jgi:asparagine synthase (glutamine-hydrolysing)
LLAGFGGDPLFAYSHSPFDWTLRQKFGRRVARELWLTLFVHHRLPRWGLRTALRKRLSKTTPPPTLPDWVNPDFARRVDLLGRWHQITAEQQSQIGQRKMHSAFWVNLFTWSHPGFNGIHLRFLFPFFDLRLMSYVSKTPTLPWREHKLLLREAMSGRLPEAVRHRPKTPLYVYREQDAAHAPWQRLALQPENQKWRRDLIITRELGPFINLERALVAIQSPVPTHTPASLDSCLPLAFWLFYRRRPQVDSNQTRGISYGSDIRPR